VHENGTIDEIRTVGLGRTPRSRRPRRFRSRQRNALAYLVNVTVRPGYDFASADDALAYGHQLCDEVAAVHGYAQIIDEIRSHFGTSDYYQATYLINQAVNELCPAQIFALRNSAASYVPPAA
jgi:hypothetical protein